MVTLTCSRDVCGIEWYEFFDDVQMDKWGEKVDFDDVNGKLKARRVFCKKCGHINYFVKIDILGV
ncbi:hypothetical protein ACFL29_01355 [Patescibacteria group bacterium]